jgi:hypothetical protein
MTSAQKPLSAKLINFHISPYVIRSLVKSWTLTGAPMQYFKFPIKKGNEADIPQRRKRNRAVFDVIDDWARQVETLNVEDRRPNFRRVLQVLDKPPTHYFWHDGVAKDFKNRTVISFGRGNKADSNTSRRYMLPIHFATMATLSLVPGIRLQTVDKTAGQNRPSNEQIHVINLNVEGNKARRLKTFKTTSIIRILFNAPSDASIRERRGKDFRFIVPENFILERRRSQTAYESTTQLEVLDAVKKLLSDNPTAHLTKSAEMVNLLTRLFRISDKQHWGDLLDRCKGDRRAIAFAVTLFS